MAQRTLGVVVPVTPEEQKRVLAWARAQEREPAQAIRFLMRGVLSGDSDAACAESASADHAPLTAA